MTKNFMSKILTVTGVTFATVAAISCSHASNDLVIESGADGTYIALGTEVGGTVTSGNSSFSFQHAKGLSVAVATGGPAPVSESESKLFMPASITKLVTTSLALEELGPDFRFSTRVTWSPGSAQSAARNLTVVADGDPQVVRAISGDGVAQQAVFDSISSQLKARGISKIEGSLILVSADERHDRAIPAEGMEDTDHTTCFGAVSQSFNFNWNCGVLSLAPKNSTRTYLASWTDSALQFPLETNLALGRGQMSITPLFDSNGRVARFSLNGSAGLKASTLALPISDVKPWYGRALLSSLEASGVEVNGVSVSLPTGAAAALIFAELPKASAAAGARSFSVVSEPLSDLIEYTNKPSDNFFADDIFKTVAAKHGDGADLREEGQRAVRLAVSHWLSATGRPELVSEIHLLDGAGLSHENRVSARAYLALLKEFSKQSWFPVLWNSLPIAGQDGTLKLRMLGSAAVGKVRAKTGTLRGAYQLAGYVPRYDARGAIKDYVPFVILSAVDPNQRFNVFNLQTDIASKLLTLVNRPKN
jgi:D-alanyl-D-alanine carboxypeptidase/D-alanyl-D-alanine-endopeptidase (penicillin-binding protein 4)